MSPPLAPTRRHGQVDLPRPQAPTPLLPLAMTMGWEPRGQHSRNGDRGSVPAEMPGAWPRLRQQQQGRGAACGELSEVVYKVYLKENHVLKRNVDQKLRIKTIYDRSVEDLLPEKRHLIKNKLFPQAISYLEKTFQVRKPTGTISLSRQCTTNQYLRKKGDPHRYCRGACAEHTRCGPVIVPEEHLQQCRICNEKQWHCGPAGLPDQEGVRDADFVLYVSALTTERCGQENIIAYAAYCQLEAEMDRPVAGYANLCPNMISTQAQEFIGMLSTVKHEIIHALGFSAGLFAFYHDDDGNPLTARYEDGLPPFNDSLGLYQWSNKVVVKAVRLWDIRGNKMLRHDVFLLITPRVVEEARKHFDCPILEGMELENQGGMGTELNHWEKRLLENEAMTGSHTQNRVFSRITLALMEDTGWYKANYSMAEKLDWGRDKGCDFVMKSCKFWIDQKKEKRQLVSPYCDTLRSNPLQLTCRQDQKAVAVCNLQKFPKQLPQEYQILSKTMVQRNMAQTLCVSFRNQHLSWHSAEKSSVTLTGAVDVIRFLVLPKG
ncbi:leishmanolysin-like peptidase isoform 3-T3 [Macrochelys suwanniensis]